MDDTPLPAEPPPLDSPPFATPARIAGLVALLMLIAGALAIGGSGDDTEDRDVSQSESQPDALPFVDETTTTTTNSPEVRLPQELGWEVTGEAYFSGCLPGTDESLPDGMWFGYVTRIDETEIEFDLACHYGIEMIDGVESPFIENADKARRTLALSPAVVNGLVDGQPDAVVTVAAGLVVEIEHQRVAG